MKGLEEFFSFARKRHQIHLDRKAGKPPPWTDDQILSQFRFTNVFRELDRTTVWFRENVRDKLQDSPEVLMATIAFRWFNRIETGEAIFTKPRGSVFSHVTAWDRLSAFGNVEVLKQTILRYRGDGPYVTAAYIIKTPNGMSKLDGVLWCIQQCWNDRKRLYEEMCGTTLKEAHEVLCEMPFMGPFMAYEVVTDLRHTHMLRHAPDKNIWANPGPGCRRGLARVVGVPLQTYQCGKMEELLEGMQILLLASQDEKFWPVDWPKWEMRDVEHTLCEFDKYERARLGEGRPKQRYIPTE